MKFTDKEAHTILRGTRAFVTYAWPGGSAEDQKALSVACRVLTEAEIDDARVEAQARVRDEAKRRGWDANSAVDMDPDLLQRAIDREVVFRAFYDPATTASEKPERFFPTPADVRSLDAVTLTRLASLYVEHQQTVSPLRHASDEEVTAIVEALGKAREPRAALAPYARSSLESLVLSMASRLRSTT